MVNTNSLKKPVEFHRRRFILGIALVVAGLAILALRGESTRTDLGQIKGNIANRCVSQHDDNACRKLLSRLLEVSKQKQRKQIVRIIRDVRQGGGSFTVHAGGRSTGPISVGPDKPQGGNGGPNGSGSPGPAGQLPTTTVTMPTIPSPPPAPSLPKLPELPLPHIICITNPLNQQPICITQH